MDMSSFPAQQRRSSAISPRITLSIPTPSAVIDVARGAILWSLDTAGLVASLPARIDALFVQVEALLNKVSAVTDDAADVVSEASDASTTAKRLIADIEPIAQRAMPLGRTFVDNFSEAEVEAAVRMVDHLPELLERMEALMPILAQMDSIAPELHQLLEVTTDVRKAVIGIPGFKFFRNRGEDRDLER